MISYFNSDEEKENSSHPTLYTTLNKIIHFKLLSPASEIKKFYIYKVIHY